MIEIGVVSKLENLNLQNILYHFAIKGDDLNKCTTPDIWYFNCVASL